MDRLAAGDLGRTGALQAALDDTVNDPTDFGGPLSADDAADRWAGMSEPDNRAPAVGAGFPGWLLQSDLLQPLAPFLSVRGDTFVIRAYGEARHPASGETRAEAWCEAVVQRLPDFVDPTDPAYAAPNGLSGINRAFGRKFRITGFRWLQPDEL